MFQHSSSLAVGRSFKAEVLSRLHQAGFDQSLLKVIDDQSQVTFKCRFGRPQEHAPVRRSQFWIPLPYHPLYCREVKAAIKRLSKLDSVQELARFVFGKATTFGAAWRIDSQPIASIVRKF